MLGALPCSSGSPSSGCTSDRNEGGRDIPTQAGGEGASLLSAGPPRCYAFAIGTERNGALVLGRAGHGHDGRGRGNGPGSGRNTLYGSAGWAEGADEHQDASGHADEVNMQAGGSSVRRGQKVLIEWGLHLDKTKLGRVGESCTRDVLANISTRSQTKGRTRR